MVAWWESMVLIEQIFASVGIAATVLLAIQVILLIIGLGGSGGDADVGDMDADMGDMDADMGDVDAGADMDAGMDADGVDIHMDADTGDISIDLPEGDFAPDGSAGDWYGDTPQGDFTAEGVVPDTSAGGLHLFTLQGMIAFFTVFGWSGLVMLRAGMAPVASVALAIVFGFIAMTLMAWAFKAMLRLQQEGTLDIRNALGKSGTVYLTIPANRAHTGKVSIVIQERLMELDAVTDEEAIGTGMEVTVIGVSNKSTLIVRRK